MRFVQRPSISLFAFLVAVGGCGDSVDSPDGGGGGTPDAAPSAPTADETACGLLKNGPSVARTATETAAGAPEVAAGAVRYDLTMPEGDLVLGAFALFTVSAARTYNVYFDEDIPLALQEDGGPTAVTISGSVESVAACTEVKRKYIIPFTPGTYELLMGPLSVASAKLVIVGE
jgi:hypothetical protein